MLNWASRFSIFCFLDNQQYYSQANQYELLLAVEAEKEFIGDTIEKLDLFIKQDNNWCFGHLSYDLKNSFYNLPPSRPNNINFPAAYFFKPKTLIAIKGNEITITSENPDLVWKEIISTEENYSYSANEIKIESRISKEEYIQIIKNLKGHISRGDCYEINFCQEFYATIDGLNPYYVFQKLMELSPNPFSAFYKLNDKFLLSASPERYLLKQKNKIISQPMKGTIKRSSIKVEDEKLKSQLINSRKDQSENIMVVDLVRNDLSKICENNSVVVEELNGAYSFPNVHQLISTVSGQLKPGISFPEIIKASFPMGSMTGAPKYKVLGLIDKYERSSRGLFSGSVGYINPEGDFDFNVIIRSILYNNIQNYLSYFVGSGITAYSDPLKEWEECLLKGELIKNLLTSLSAG